MQVHVLGPTAVHSGTGGPVAALSYKQRALLAALVMNRGREVRAEALIELIWPAGPPRTASGTLQTYVAAVRRLLEPDREPRAPAEVLITVDGSYRLALTDQSIDAARFDMEVQAVHRLVADGRAPDAPPSVAARLTADEVEGLEARLSQILSTWRGTPYGELGDAPPAVAERARLEELRLVALEDRALLRLVSGQRPGVAAEVESLVRAHPFRESLRAVHVIALVTSGRQGDALAALRQARGQLADELGVDPGPMLRGLELAVLRHEPVIAMRMPATDSSHPARDGRQSTSGDVPLVGRNEELTRLTDLLAMAEVGRPQFVVVVGEAGIGKSRLARALAEVASDRGFAVVTGRCVQDEGAPPSWPWTTLLRTARSLVTAGAPGGGARPRVAGLITDASAAGKSATEAAAAQFHAREAVVLELQELTVHRPLLAVIEDAHWADVSSARLLQHLAETLETARLLLIVTRRSGPGGGPAVAEAVEALARRPATRIDLGGLGAEETATLVGVTTGLTPGPTEVELLRSRTRGNPFFLLELARMHGSSDVPATVGEIVARRLATLPASTQELLRMAAVVGEFFDLGVLAVSCSMEVGDSLAALEPAVDLGVIRAENEPEVFSFSHALVRDAVYAISSPSRRARRHAAVAQALHGRAAGQSRDAPATAVAWHWLAAGPRWAARAWRAAAAAAGEATALHAYEEAAALLKAAAVAADQDPECSWEQRYDLLLARLHACVACGDRLAVQEVAVEAVRQAWHLGDARRAAMAAVAAADGAIWALRPYGVVDHGMVHALERALRELPPADMELRCRVLLVLAAELYYADSSRQRQALVDEGLAMARRLGDPALLAWGCLMAPIAIWNPDTALIRHALADEAVTAATLAGSQTMLTDALARRAAAALELGRIAEVSADEEAARAIADRLQLAYPLIALDMMMIPWRAMQGRFDEAATLAQQVLTLAPRARLQPGEGVEVGALLPLLMWQGKTQEALALVPDIDDPLLQVGRRLLLMQTGQIDELRASWEQTGDPDPPQDWFALFRLCEAAATAFALDLSATAAVVYRRLAPYAGSVASAGASGPLGPVDTYLALAAAAAGQRATATRHADDALALCVQWRLPACAQAVRAMRESAGF